MSDIVWTAGTPALLGGTSWLERAAMTGLKLSSKVLESSHFKGYGRIAAILRKAAPDRHIVLELNADSRFRFPFGDAYWSRLLEPTVVYEPEMLTLLTQIRDADYAFIDCGANFGYWSVLVSGRDLGAHPVLAIEASGRNAAELRANAELNTNRFDVLHAAVAEADGGTVMLGGPTHEGLAIVSSEDAAVGAETVSCMSLDGILSRNAVLRDSSRLVLKLDVEGVETQALRGAAEMLNRETLLIYEEQGSDLDHANTLFVAKELGMTVFVLDGQRFVRADDPVATVAAMKVNPRRGYNVVATRSPEWIARMSN